MAADDLRNPYAPQMAESLGRFYGWAGAGMGREILRFVTTLQCRQHSLVDGPRGAPLFEKRYHSCAAYPSAAPRILHAKRAV